MQLIRGQKIKLHDLAPSLATVPTFELNIALPATPTLDAAVFGLDAQGKLSNEAYMVFYNQPQSPCGGIYLSHNSTQQANFSFDLARLPASIVRLVLTLTIDGSQVMAQLPPTPITLRQHGQTLASFILDGEMLAQEKALMALEIYQKDGVWRVNAYAQGFSGGLAALIEHFGGEVAQDNPPAPTAPTPSPKLSPTPAPSALPTESSIELKKRVSLQKAQQTGNSSIIDLTKKSLVQLEKRNLLDVKARVALVLDASGSMDWQYQLGDVQEVVNRLMPLAINFDDDGSFECWAFAQYTVQLDDVTLHNVNDFINQTQSGWRHWNVGARYNQEIPAIQAVIDYYQIFTDNVPVYVLFISDGGVGNARQMKDIITRAATLPIFWQFVGIGGSNYGVLEKLDTLSRRVVDNCNFFALDDIHSLSDDALYAKLLNEFPLWLTAAKQARILA